MMIGKAKLFGDEVSSRIAYSLDMEQGADLRS